MIKCLTNSYVVEVIAVKFECLYLQVSSGVEAIRFLYIGSLYMLFLSKRQRLRQSGDQVSSEGAEVEVIGMNEASATIVDRFGVHNKIVNAEQ